MTFLADSSTWVDALRNKASWLRSNLQAQAAIAYTEPVLMEVLMGARTTEEGTRLRQFMTGAELLPCESIADFEGAALINRHGRGRGISVGKFDCLILAVAYRSRATLVTADLRQAELGRVIGLDVTMCR